MNVFLQLCQAHDTFLGLTGDTDSHSCCQHMIAICLAVHEQVGFGNRRTTLGSIVLFTVNIANFMSREICRLCMILAALITVVRSTAIVVRQLISSSASRSTSDSLAGVVGVVDTVLDGVGTLTAEAADWSFDSAVVVPPWMRSTMKLGKDMTDSVTRVIHQCQGNLPCSGSHAADKYSKSTY